MFSCYLFVKHYEVEVSGSSLKGNIICGSTPGYEGGKGFDLEQTLAFLDEVNREITESGLASIPCIVTEGTLVDRSDSGLYREGGYTFGFSWSPRIPAPERNIFYQTLMQYANSLGDKMGQERMSVEFEGETSVLRKKNS